MLDDFIQETANRDTYKAFMGGNGDFIEVKSVTDKDFVNAQSRHNKQYKTQLKNPKTTNEALQRILAPLVVQLLVDWKMSATKEAMAENLPDIKCKKLDDDNVLIPFNAENARAILTNPKYWNFLQFILDCAKEHSNFVSDDMEDDEKNS